MNSNSNNFREMFWDESNRLRVVYDQNSYQMQHYIYDAAGERTLKASSKIENVYENGQVDVNNTTMGLYTTYVSPYMVVDANQKYSKHYFNGTQRVASKIGEQDIAIFENGNQYLKQANSKATENTPATDFDTLKNKQITDFSYYLSKSINNASAKNLKVNYTEYKKVDTNTETTSAKTADNNSAYAAPQYAELYYYHSDHLGTGTFLSDFDGNPYQFFLNLPFGETMVEQHSYSGDYTNRYKFNGKELDEETGFYYYGARYYNPKFSIWLSVDPLAEKYPSHSPYCYVMNNPINAIDPDGRLVIFVNGLWGRGTGASDGGTARHWGRGWVSDAQNAIGDSNARFYDGSSDMTGKTGGVSRLSFNMDPINRYSSGYKQGRIDASSIVNSLERDSNGNITESIKIVTSSMGAAYSRGMTKAIVNYVNDENAAIDLYNNGLAKDNKGNYLDPSKVIQRLNVVFEFTLDLDAFQAKNIKADPNCDANYFMKADGWESNFIGGNNVPGSTEIGSSNMKHHHPSWAPTSHFPKGKMNPVISSRRPIENPTN